MTRAERLAEFHRSLERATAEPEFLDRFYKSFMAISPKIQRVFEGTDMARLPIRSQVALASGTDAFEGIYSPLMRNA